MAETRVLFIAWGAAALVLILVATRVGPKATRPWNLVLSQSKKKHVSLMNLQLTLWTIVVLSMLTGLFVARLVDDPGTALDFEIPPELLLVMGISASSTVLASTVTKDPSGTDAAAAATPAAAAAKPRIRDAMAPPDDDTKQPEITRVQNFWLTFIVVAAYVALGIATFADTGDADRFKSLPELSGGVVALLAISHGGYLAKKTADNSRNGTDPGT